MDNTGGYIMGVFKLDGDEQKWFKTFNIAMKGYVHILPEIAPPGLDIAPMVRGINQERNARRRDVMSRDQRVNLYVADMGMGVLTQRSFEPIHSDNPVEDAILEALDAPTTLRVVRGGGRAPVQGSEVQIAIPGHFYDKHRGYIVASRKGGSEYLVEITTKRPDKKNPDVKGQLWVTVQDFQII